MKTLYGLIGKSLSHSISPVLHSIILKKLNIEGYYHLFEINSENLKTSIDGLNCLGCKGANVTIPYKMETIKYLDLISDQAKLIGSVNTIEFTREGTVGHNTDYFGLKRTFEKYDVELKNKEAVILGSGGASATAVQLLKDCGISDIIVVVRDLNKIKNIESFKNLRSCAYKNLDAIYGKDILINCTPVGMYPNIDECLLPADIIGSFSVIIDLIYNPKETLLLKNARLSGAKGINGLYMLVSQAVESQKIWNDFNITYEFIDEVFKEIENVSEYNG